MPVRKGRPRGPRRAPFAKALADARGGLTMAQAAKLCGVPGRTWSKWEESKRTPPKYVQWTVLQKLEDARRKRDRQG